MNGNTPADNVVTLRGKVKPSQSFTEQLAEWLRSPPEAAQRTWRTSRAGNAYLRAGRWVFTVFYNEGNRWHSAGWNASVKDTETGASRFLPESWASEEVAKAAVSALAARLEGDR
jgi:hypothetical protein